MFTQTTTYNLISITILVIFFNTTIALSTSEDNANPRLVSTQNVVQKIIPFTVINFFELTNPEICKGVSVTQFDISKLWIDEEFLKFASKFEPKEVKPKFEVYLDDLIKDQMNLLNLHFENLKKNLLDNFNKSEEEFFKNLSDRYILDFQKQFQLFLIEKKCKENEKELLEKLKKIESMNKKKDLLNLLFTGENGQKIAIDYYLDNSDCKKQLMEELLIGTDFPRISNDWKDNYFTKANKFLNSNYKKYHDTKVNYLEFIDFNSINKRETKGSEYILAKKEFFNLDVYDFFFINYTEKQQKLFQILYKVINLHRLSYNGPKEKQIEDFSQFLDKHNFAEEDRDYYLLIKLLFYYHRNQQKAKILYNINKDSKRNSLLVKKLIEEIPQMKNYIVKVNKELGLTLQINEFKEAVGQSTGNTLDDNIAKYFDDLILKSEYKGENQDFPFYLDELKLGGDKMSSRKNEIENSVLLYVFNYLQNEKKINFVKLKSFNIIFNQFLQEEKSHSLELLGRIFKILDNEENKFSLYFQNMHKFFNNERVLNYMKRISERLTENKDIIVDYCKELILDFKIFTGNASNFCSKVKQQKLPEFKDNFFQNFIKIKSFMKMFDFYDNEDRSSVNQFIILYRFISMKKSTYQIETLENNLPKEYDQFLTINKSGGNLIKENENLLEKTNSLIDKNLRENLNDNEEQHIRYRDIMRLFNLRNIGLSTKNLDEINFNSLMFSKLKIIIDFFQKANNSEYIISYLDKVYNYYKDRKEDYHFNNLYLIIKIDNIRRNSTKVKIELINNIFISINNFERKDFSELNSYHRVKTSRNAALFFYLEYANYFKYTEYDAIMKLLQDDLRKLSNEEKLYFFGTRIFKVFNVLTDVTKLEDVKFDEKLIIVEVRKKISNYLMKVRSGEYNSDGLLKSFLAADMFSTLWSIKSISEIYKLKLFEEIIDNILPLFKRNNNNQHVLKYTFYMNENITDNENNEENFLFFNYYLTSYFFSKYNSTIETNEKIYSYLQNFIDTYFKNLKDSVYNVKNYYLTSKFLLLKVYPTDEFSIDTNKEPHNPLEINNLTYFTFFNKELRNHLNKIEKPEIIPKTMKLITSRIQKLESQKGEFDYKYKLYLKEENKNIFKNICKYEEFDIIFRDSEINFNLENLQKIQVKCLKENKVEILNDNSYQLIRVLRDYHQSNFVNPEIVKYIRKLFNSIISGILKKVNKENLFIIFQRVLLNKENVLVNKDFIKFLTKVAQKYTMKELTEVENGLIKKKWIDADEKKIMAEMFFRDFITFYDFKGEVDINKLDFNDIDLFDIIMFKQKYAFFLTNIFNKSKFDSEFAVREYLNFYFLLNRFRFVEMSNQNILPAKNEKYSKLKLDFTIFLGHEYEKKPEKELKTRILFMIVSDYFYNLKNAEKLNVGEQDFYCNFIADLGILLQDNTENVKINLKEFVSYVETNSEIKNNLEFYFYENKKILEEKEHEYLFKDCVVPREQRENALKYWNSFYLKLYPEIDFNKKHTPDLELGFNTKNVRFNKKAFFKQNEILLI